MPQYDITVITDGGSYRQVLRVEASNEEKAKELAVNIANSKAQANNHSSSGKFKAIGSKTIF